MILNLCIRYVDFWVKKRFVKLNYFSIYFFSIIYFFVIAWDVFYLILIFDITLSHSSFQYMTLPSCVQTFLKSCFSLPFCNIFIILILRFSVMLLLDPLRFFYSYILIFWCCDVQTLQLLALISRLAFFQGTYGFDQYFK